MSTMQVEDDVKRELLAAATELQSELGGRVSLSEAIRVFLGAYRASKRDLAKLLSLFESSRPNVRSQKAPRRGQG